MDGGSVLVLPEPRLFAISLETHYPENATSANLEADLSPISMSQETLASIYP